MDSVWKLLSVPMSRLASLSWNRQKVTPKPATPKPLPVLGEFSPRPQKRRRTDTIFTAKIDKNNTTLGEF